MPQEIMKRHAIIEALCTDRTAKEIIDFLITTRTLFIELKSNLKLVMTLRPSLEREKPTSDILMPSGSNVVMLFTEFVTKVKQRIQDDLSKFMAALAFEMNVNKSTIFRTVAKDLNMKSYCLRKRHLLTAALIEQRLIKGTALLNELKHGSFSHVRFFSDEKKFIQDKLYNGQNDHFITDNPEEFPL